MYCAECVVTTPNVGVAHEDIDLSSDRMYVSGFAAIAKVRSFPPSSPYPSFPAAFLTR